MTFSSHLLIRASAGSGKTHQLTSRFIGLLIAGEEPSGILAVTFTRLAAGEIMERVLGRMLDAIHSDAGIDQLQQSLIEAGFPSPSRDQVKDALQRLIDDLHLCRVSTLDAFFSRLASAHTFECGLPSGWTILDPDQLHAIQADAIQKILAQGGPREARQLMHRLSRGKATSQVADNLRDIVSATHDKYLEFPAEAWNNPGHFAPPGSNEIDQVREQFLSVPCPLTKTGTPHKSWRDALDKLKQSLDDPAGINLKELLKSGLPKKILDGEIKYYGEEIPDEIRVTVQLLLNTLRPELAAKIGAQNLATRDLLRNYDHFRSEGLQARGGVGYQDIPLALTSAAVLAAPGTILYRLDASTRHLLLDEFQDTSMLQFAALEPLVDEVRSDQDGGRTIFCVGDAKQAIYGWRGGHAEVLDLMAGYLIPDSERSLDASYRSSPQILECVNQVFGQLPIENWLPDDQSAISGWCRNFHEHIVAPGGPGDAPGHVVLKVANQHPDRKPAVCPFIDAIEEVKKSLQHCPDASIAVLVRKNAYIARMVAALKAQGIDSSEEGGNPLVDSAAVGKLVALLELIEHPGDATMRFAVARSPLPNIAAVIDGFPAGDWQDPLVAETIATFFRNRIHQLGIVAAISPIAAELACISSPEDRTRIHQMLEQLHIRRPDGCRLEDLITHLRTHSLKSPSGSQVQVMTVHQAKGLGRDVVILPELATDWLRPHPKLLEQKPAIDDPGTNPVEPIISRHINEQERHVLGEPYIEMNRQGRQSRLQEELSILYVAMTRARRSLTMIIPPVKSLPKASGARLLWHTLGQEQPLDAGAVLYRQGTEDAVSHIVGSPSVATVTAQIPALEVSTAATHRSPSQHIALFPTEESFRARSIGTLTHNALEILDWSAELPADVEQLLVRQNPRLTEYIESSLQLLRPALEEDELVAILDRQATGVRLGEEEGDRLVLEREVPFSCQLDQELLNGIIDRLVILERNGKPIAAEVIDFKTDQIFSSARETAEKHRQQLESYRDAVSRTWGIDLDRISTRIALVRTGEVVNL